MRKEMACLLMTLDEKNHVMNTAIEGLEKQLKRCQSSYPHIEDEISEEARLGSMNHWAYNTDKATEKKGMVAGERTRRAANHLAAENEPAAVRSEARREAVAARKGRQANVDSDFDDVRSYGKKAQSIAKGRKAGDTVYGLGIANAPVPSNKRRKIEKPATGGFNTEKVMQSVYSFGARGASPAIDGAGRKKTRGGALAAGNARRRQVAMKDVPIFAYVLIHTGATPTHQASIHPRWLLLPLSEPLRSLQRTDRVDPPPHRPPNVPPHLAPARIPRNRWYSSLVTGPLRQTITAQPTVMASTTLPLTWIEHPASQAEAPEMCVPT